MLHNNFTRPYYLTNIILSCIDFAWKKMREIVAKTEEEKRKSVQRLGGHIIQCIKMISSDVETSMKSIKLSIDWSSYSLYYWNINKYVPNDSLFSSTKEKKSLLITLKLHGCILWCACRLKLTCVKAYCSVFRLDSIKP